MIFPCSLCMVLSPKETTRTWDSKNEQTYTAVMSNMLFQDLGGNATCIW